MKGTDCSCERDCAYWNKKLNSCKKGHLDYQPFVADQCPDFDGKHKTLYDWY